LEALGRTRNPEAVPLLAMVVREPAPALTVSAAEKRQSADRKTAAAKALANFSNPEAAQALVHILKSEKDVALRDRAHESLQAATGRQLPADPQAWENLLSEGMPQPQKSSGIDLTSWWK
jgi:HEAT repeat protein